MLHTPRHHVRGIGGGDAGQRQREFIAAGARQPIVDLALDAAGVVGIQRALIAQAVLQTVRHLLQQAIADRLPLRVVDA